jgi:uncharacterized repeat protein (TIGR03803 family)
MSKLSVVSIISLVAGAASPALAQYTVTTLANFGGGNGVYPGSSLIVAGSTLYGASSDGDGPVFSVPITGGTPTVVAWFNGSNGYFPFGGLTVVSSTLYGTTGFGGAGYLGYSYTGAGTVFSVPTTGGTPTTLANFDAESTGVNPAALIVVGNTLYGTTEGGGADGYGYGTVFSLPITGGTPTVLATFSGPNGEGPDSLIVSGNTLYGTTVGGGANGDGEVFSVPTTGGTPTVLASFNGTNGALPEGSLMLSGNSLYGTTVEGGAGYISGDPYSGYGTVFSVPTIGGTPTALVSFDGSGVYGLALIGSTLYGTTEFGGDLSLNGGYGDGTVFSVPITGGAVSTLAALNSSTGWDPGCLTAVGNNLYGIMGGGGTYGDGTIFELSVPEPVTGSLLLIAGAGILMRRRRRQSA